jgi:hypothetical protein
LAIERDRRTELSGPAGTLGLQSIPHPYTRSGLASAAAIAAAGARPVSQAHSTGPAGPVVAVGTAVKVAVGVGRSEVAVGSVVGDDVAVTVAVRVDVVAVGVVLGVGVGEGVVVGVVGAPSRSTAPMSQLGP